MCKSYMALYKQTKNGACYLNHVS